VPILSRAGKKQRGCFNRLYAERKSTVTVRRHATGGKGGDLELPVKHRGEEGPYFILWEGGKKRLSGSLLRPGEEKEDTPARSAQLVEREKHHRFVPCENPPCGGGGLVARAPLAATERRGKN